MLWKLTAPLSPFFLTSLLDGLCTNTYDVDILYLSRVLEDNTQEEGDTVVVDFAVILIRVGSTTLPQPTGPNIITASSVRGPGFASA
ncbi:hypothetical protein BGY98DRAFT_1009150, partial [Russula aff. rugulosa BPL654]